MCLEENRVLCPFPNRLFPLWKEKLHITWNKISCHCEIHLNLKPISKLLNPVRILNNPPFFPLNYYVLHVTSKIVFLNDLLSIFKIILFIEDMHSLP